MNSPVPPQTAGPLLSLGAAVAQTCRFGSVTPAIGGLRVLCFLGLAARLARLAQGQKNKKPHVLGFRNVSQKPGSFQP